MAMEWRRSTSGLSRTRRWPRHGRRRPVASWPREQAERRRLLGGDGATAVEVTGKRGAGGAAHDGECGGAHGRTRGSPKRWGRDGGQLGHGGRGHGGSVLACMRRGRAPGRARASAGCVVTLGRSYLEAQGAGLRVAWSSDAHRPWGASSGAWRPRRQNVEHVASVGEGKVGSRFGPLPGRNRPWAKNEVCSPRTTLHFSLRDSSHWSIITVGN